jgi:hypothetical protein
MENIDIMPDKVGFSVLGGIRINMYIYVYRHTQKKHSSSTEQAYVGMWLGSPIGTSSHTIKSLRKANHGESDQCECWQFEHFIFYMWE